MGAEACFVVGRREGGVDLGELEHHGDVKGADAGELDAEGEFGLREGGGGNGSREGGDVKVGSDFAAFEAGSGAAAGVFEVGRDLGGVGDARAQAVGECGRALDGGAYAHFVTDRGAQVEDACDGDAGAGDACCEELFGVGKSVDLFNGGDGGCELKHGTEVLGLALEGEGFQAEKGDGHVAGEFKRACGVAVDAVDFDSLLDVWVGEDVRNFVRRTGTNVESDRATVIERA